MNIVKGLESKTEKIPVIQEPDKDKGRQHNKGEMKPCATCPIFLFPGQNRIDQNSNCKYSRYYGED